ncbi:hypothetical protein [Clostridium beijerinckii]|nr:hypothetical protein [Clostridium beijerinckii]
MKLKVLILIILQRKDLLKGDYPMMSLNLGNRIAFHKENINS